MRWPCVGGADDPFIIIYKELILIKLHKLCHFYMRFNSFSESGISGGQNKHNTKANRGAPGNQGRFEIRSP